MCNSRALDGSYDGSAACLTEIGVTYGGSYDIKTGTQHLVILRQQDWKDIQPCAAAIGEKWGEISTWKECLEMFSPKNLTSLILLYEGVSNPWTRQGPVQKQGRCCSCGFNWAIWTVWSDLHDISLVKEQRVKDLKRIFSGKNASGTYQTLSLAPMGSNTLFGDSGGGSEIWLVPPCMPD